MAELDRPQWMGNVKTVLQIDDAMCLLVPTDGSPAFRAVIYEWRRPDGTVLTWRIRSPHDPAPHAILPLQYDGSTVLPPYDIWANHYDGAGWCLVAKVTGNEITQVARMVDGR